MEKGLLYFTISVAFLWLLLDEFFGTSKISGLAKKLTPDIQNPISAAVDSVKDKTEEIIKGSKSEKDIQKDKKKVKDSINKSNTNDKAKKAINDAVDKFYDEANFYKDGKYQDQA